MIELIRVDCNLPYSESDDCITLTFTVSKTATLEIVVTDFTEKSPDGVGLTLPSTSFIFPTLRISFSLPVVGDERGEIDTLEELFIERSKGLADVGESRSVDEEFLIVERGCRK